MPQIMSIADYTIAEGGSCSIERFGQRAQWPLRCGTSPRCRKLTIDGLGIRSQRRYLEKPKETSYTVRLPTRMPSELLEEVGR